MFSDQLRYLLPPSHFRLQKRVQDRSTLQQLLGHPFLEHHGQAPTDVASFVADILDNSSAEDELEGGRNRGGAANNHNGR